MSDNATTEPISSEWIAPEQYLGPRMKRITFECSKCGHLWTRTYKAEPKNNPSCPNKRCAEKSEVADLKRQLANLTAMLQSGVAPAQIGNNIRTRAIDYTAEVVMHDNNLTDLKDNIRMGETMAPKLPPAQQKQADTLFATAGKTPVIGPSRGGSVSSKVLQRIGARAIAGGYANNSVKPTAVLPKSRPGMVSVPNPGYVKR